VTLKLVGAFVLATSLICLVPASSVEASGSYSSRPARPPSSVDRNAYELGKKIFAGEFTPGSQQSEAAEQKRLLEELRGRLPAAARARSNFTELGGRLDDEQVAALQYYLKKRYKIR
jgi:hypothetical protein